MAKKRLARFSVNEAEEFFRGNRLNIYGQETFIELYGRAGEDNSNIWFEDLGANLVIGSDGRPLPVVTGRYCIKRASEGKRERYETEFRSLENGKVEVVREGPYRLRYR